MPKETMNRCSNHQHHHYRYLTSPCSSSSSSGKTGVMMSCLRSRTSPPAAVMPPYSFHAGSLFLTPRKVSFEDNGTISSNSSTGSHESSYGDYSGRHQQYHYNHDTTTTASTPSSPITRKRSLLSRPKSTMSLVDLAKSAEEKEQLEQGKNAIATTATTTIITPTTSNAIEREDSPKVMIDDIDMGEPQAKRICSPRVLPLLPPVMTLSPLPSTKASFATAVVVPNSSSDSNDAYEATSTGGELTTGPSSLSWGQFVDMLVPEEEEEKADLRTVASPSSFFTFSNDHMYYHECNNSNRRYCHNVMSYPRSRRSSPYHNNGRSHENTRINHAFGMMSRSPPSSLHLQQYTLSSSKASSSSSKFRLTPRKNSSTNNHNDQEFLIVGALADLNF
jgi:hypothetical protein